MGARHPRGRVVGRHGGGAVRGAWPARRRRCRGGCGGDVRRPESACAAEAGAGQAGARQGCCAGSGSCGGSASAGAAAAPARLRWSRWRRARRSWRRCPLRFGRRSGRGPRRCARGTGQARRVRWRPGSQRRRRHSEVRCVTQVRRGLEVRRGRGRPTDRHDGRHRWRPGAGPARRSAPHRTPRHRVRVGVGYVADADRGGEAHWWRSGVADGKARQGSHHRRREGRWRGEEHGNGARRRQRRRWAAGRAAARPGWARWKQALHWERCRQQGIRGEQQGIRGRRDSGASSRCLIDVEAGLGRWPVRRWYRAVRPGAPRAHRERIIRSQHHRQGSCGWRHHGPRIVGAPHAGPWLCRARVGRWWHRGRSRVDRVVALEARRAARPRRASPHRETHGRRHGRRRCDRWWWP